MFLFSGDEPHCITDATERFELLNVHFEPRILWDNNENLSLLRIMFERSGSFKNRIDRDNPSTKAIHNDIIAIQKELSEEKPGYGVIAKYRLFSVFVSLLRNYDYVDNSNDYSAYQRTVRPIEKALNYIDKNLYRPITLAEIAQNSAMSQTYFSVMFKKLNGITPWEYITIRRVERAIELISTTNMTKLDIALQCGFNSSSNFYKAFFKVTGKKPSSFKSKYTGNSV